MAWNQGGAAFPQPSNTGTDAGLTQHDYFTSEVTAAIVQGMLVGSVINMSELHRMRPDEISKIVEVARRFADSQIAYVARRGG
jgi:hypothetical protein